jgi:CheY-like chemotaxis protein
MSIFGRLILFRAACRRARPVGSDEAALACARLAARLRAMGHDAQFTQDPREALRQAKEMRAQLAFLDLSMPHIEGCALAIRFRTDPDLTHTCLIALTAYDDGKHRALTRAAGFDAHIKKPIDPTLLAHIVAHFAK